MVFFDKRRNIEFPKDCMSDCQHNSIVFLSGGQRMSVALTSVLLSTSDLLMLDEPSMGLAPILVEQIFEIIQNLHKAGTTILLVEQNAQAALSVADRGYVLETGKIVTTGTGAELLSSPAIKKAYLGG